MVISRRGNNEQDNPTMILRTPDTMPIIKRDDGYWIEPTNAEAGERIGPYNTVTEAEKDRRGVLRFLRRLDAGENPFE